MEQQIRFCTTGDGVRIAYATAGAGPPLVRVGTWLTHLEYDWRSKIWQHWLEELARDHLLVRYDQRGNGLSDRDVEELTLDTWLRDLESVVDALGLKQFAMLGMSQGGPIAAAYAVRHPGRVSQLVLHGTYTCGWALSEHSRRASEEMAALLTLTRTGWGRNDPTYRQIFTSAFIPDANAEQARWFNDLQRMSASSEGAARAIVAFGQLDARELWPRVNVPSLVTHGRGDGVVPFADGREVAALIPNARFVPLETKNHLLLADEPAWQVFLAEVRRFLGSELSGESAAVAGEASPPITILFTDMAGSTSMTERLGDANAQVLLQRHDALVREAVTTHGGTEIKHTGDGIMASFRSASRAVECAIQMQRRLSTLNESDVEQIHIRVGINAGEPVLEHGDLFGTAVQLAARACAHAEPDHILVADVVRQLVAGKGFSFVDQGDVSLKGFEQPARLHDVAWRA